MEVFVIEHIAVQSVQLEHPTGCIVRKEYLVNSNKATIHPTTIVQRDECCVAKLYKIELRGESPSGCYGSKSFNPNKGFARNARIGGFVFYAAAICVSPIIFLKLIRP